MSAIRRPILTRKRVLLTAAVFTVAVLAAWFGGRHAVVRWALHRALMDAGLEPATFQVRSVGLTSLKLVDLSFGATPWLTADGVEATYSLLGLVSGRAKAVRVQGARWTVQVQHGQVHWGFSPRPSPNSGPVALDLPCDSVDLQDSTITIIEDGNPRVVPITARVTPIQPHGIACQVDIVALERAVSLTVQARTTASALTLDLEGQAGFPSTDQAAPTTPQARLHASIAKSLTDGSMQVDAAVTIDSWAQRAGDVDVAVSRMTVEGGVTLDAQGALAAATASLVARDVLVGDVSLGTIELAGVRTEATHIGLEGRASGQGWNLPRVVGTVVMASDAGDGSTPMLPASFTIELRSAASATLEVDSNGARGSIDSFAATATVRADASSVRLVEGALEIHGGSLHTEDVVLANLEAAAVMPSPGVVELTSLTAIVGDGAAISAAPFTVDLSAPRPRTRFTITNLSLAEWLPVISAHHATGEGRVNGYIDLGVDLTTGTPKLDYLGGALAADPPHGFIQASDAEALGALLDAQDPRMATDEVMRPVRDKIVMALGDFAFHAMTVDLSRNENQTVARAYLSGFGRHGEDPQGLNITLDLHVPDALIELASRIATESKIRGAARNALDRFFDTPAAEDTRP